LISLVRFQQVTPFLPLVAKRAINRKSRARKIYNIKKTKENWQRYAKARNFVSDAVRKLNMRKSLSPISRQTTNSSKDRFLLKILIVTPSLPSNIMAYPTYRQ